MNTYTVRRVVAACAVAGSLLTVPAESQAIFHWFGGGCCGGGTTAYRPYTAAYAPYYAAYAPAPTCNTGCSPCASACTSCYSPCASPCNTCSPCQQTCSPCQQTCSPCQQTCSYVPQTCYRTVYQQVPVTSCQPVSGCDTCGNQVTAMRPVITYQTQARLVPYTTYRPVYTPMVSYSPAPVSCATGNCGRSGCSTCGQNTGAPGYSSPGSTFSSAPTNIQGGPGSLAPGQTPTPDPYPTNSSPPSTFQSTPGPVKGESRLQTNPDQEFQGNEPSNKSTNSTLTPRLLKSDDRTTYRPSKRIATVIPVSAEENLDDDGWRAARK